MNINDSGIATKERPYCQSNPSAQMVAELSVDELLEVDDMPEEEAAALIMTARAPWFEEENQDS